MSFCLPLFPCPPFSSYLTPNHTTQPTPPSLFPLRPSFVSWGRFQAYHFLQFHISSALISTSYQDFTDVLRSPPWCGDISHLSSARLFSFFFAQFKKRCSGSADKAAVILAITFFLWKWNLPENVGSCDMREEPLLFWVGVFVLFLTCWRWWIEKKASICSITFVEADLGSFGSQSTSVRGSPLSVDPLESFTSLTFIISY